MKANRNQPAAHRIFGILIIFALVSGLFSSQGTYPASAQIATESPTPQNDGASELQFFATFEDAIESGLREYEENTDLSFALHIVTSTTEDDYGYASVQPAWEDIPIEEQDEFGFLLLAKNTVDGWYALAPHIVPNEIYNDLLLSFPDSLLDEFDKGYHYQYDIPELTSQAVSGHKLPWQNGHTAILWRVNGADHTNQIDFDIAPQSGTWHSAAGYVYASKPGTVVYVKEVSPNPSAAICNKDEWRKANVVIIKHSNSEYSWYYHFAHNSVIVNEGDSVNYGTRIGQEGRTGFTCGTTGIHLHYHVSTSIPSLPSRTDQNVAPWPLAGSITTVDFQEVAWSNLVNNATYTSQNTTGGGTTQPRNAQYVSQSVPTTMTAGQQYSVSVTMKNTGSTSWTYATNFKLGSQNPQDNTTWGFNRRYISSNETIATNQNKTFTFTVTAPSVPGTYNFRWRMLQEGVAWFGDYTPNVAVNVQAGGSAPSAPSSPNPSSSTTLSRTNNTTLSWSTNGSSCQVFIQGGSVNISPSGGCSSLALGQQRGGAYSWYVRSTNGYGTTTGPTWTFNIRPYGPSGLSASAASANQINLSWSLSSDDDGTNVDGYDIYRNGAHIASVNKGVSSYQSTGLACNTNYSYYVRSKRQGVQSDNSNTVNATTGACAPGTPTLNTPSNNATFGRYDATILSWNSASGATQYYAEFWGDSGISINSGWTSSLSFNVGSTFWGGTYQWRVKSRNSSGVESGWSETRTLYRTYGSPSNLTATGTSQSQINLSWGASADAPGNIQGYRIYRNGTVIATVGSSTTSYNDTGVSCHNNYTYTVRAYKGTLESNASNTANASPINCPPVAPSNLTVSGATSSSITLSWQDSSNNESGFRIYRWRNGDNGWAFYHLATVGANITTYTQTGLVCGSDSNYYQVSSYNSHGESVRVDWEWVQGTTSPCPPSDLQVTNISIDPLSARTNDNVYVYVEIANLSTTAAPPFYLDLYIDKVPGSCPSTGDYWARINGLPANSSRTWYFEIPADTLSAGAHQIRAFADSFCEVTESNENNNISSPVSFTLTAPPAAPTHDDLNTARLISPLPYTNIVDVSGATRALDDPSAASCNLRPGRASVWYLYTPTTNRTLTFDTLGSSYDTYIAVWTGTRGALTPVDCNDDAVGTLQSKVTVNLSANTTYYVQVAQWNGWLVSGASGTSLESDPQLPPGAQSDEPDRPQSGRQPAYTDLMDLMDSLSDDKPRSDVDALAGGTLHFHAKPVSEITVTIGGGPMGTYALASGEEQREYYNASGGPVKVESLNGADIVSAIRLQSFANNTLHSFVETMGVPEGLLSHKYYFPTYNNTWTPLNSQVRFGNLDANPTTIRVTIGGVNVWQQVVPGLEERRLNFPVSGGPVVVESLDTGKKIVAAIRLQSFANNTLLSFSETMGIPAAFLSDVYFFPTYNNTWTPLNSQLRFGAP